MAVILLHGAGNRKNKGLYFTYDPRRAIPENRPFYRPVSSESIPTSVQWRPPLRGSYSCHSHTIMKRFLAIATSGLAVTALLASVKLAEAIKHTSVHEIAEHPGKFHKSNVIVTGTVSHVNVKVPRRGTRSMTFILTEPDKRASMVVSSRGYTTVRDGATVSVEGIFDRSTRNIVAYAMQERR